MNNSSWKSIFRAASAAFIDILCTAAFFSIWYPFVVENNNTGYLTGLGNLLMAIILFALVTGGFLLILGGLQIGRSSLADILTAQIISFLLADIMEVLISCAITGQYRYWPQFLWRYSLLFLFESAVVGVLTYFLMRLYRRLFPPLHVLEICGDHKNCLDLKFATREDLFRLDRKLNATTDLEEVREAIRGYDAVLLNDLPGKTRNKVLKLCYELDKPVFFTPKLSDVLVKYSKEFNLFDTPLYYRSNLALSIWERIIKRFFDILLSFVALVVLSPLFLAVMAAIKLEDGGPVFYKQQRATLNGEVFWILKFRSMIDHAEADGKSHPAENNDKRISKVGAVIRATRMDELPQLINILKGDMSIVGPRPERLEHVAAYAEMVPEFAYRLKMKGGLTGYAQVYGKYNTTPLDKLKLDLIYITNYSLLFDVRIILETIKIIFSKESTEGFPGDAGGAGHTEPDARQ